MDKQFIKGYVTKIADGKYRVLASTAAVDRQGDSVDQAGWDLSNFKLNPVMLWAHDYSELPTAKVNMIEVTKRGLEAEFEFAPEEGNPKAQQLKILYDKGFLNAVSVGFIAKERKGNVITKSELLEISFVPVPANQQALRLALESKSVDISDLPEVKGAIETEINLEEMFEKKWKNWESVCDVMGAFWKVYFDETTPVEDFPTLLTEAIGLLQKLTEAPVDTEEGDGEGEEDGASNEEGKSVVSKAIAPENTKAFIDTLAEKSGRVLSKKTLEIIEAAIESMKSTASVLEDLKSSSENQDGQGSDTSANEEKGSETPKEEIDGVTLTTENAPIIRQALVAKDKTNELALAIVNNFLKSQGVK